MKKTTTMFVVLTGIAHAFFASSRMGRPLHNSPADMLSFQLEPAILEPLSLEQSIAASGQGRVVCVAMRGHISPTNLDRVGCSLNLRALEKGACKGNPEEERKKKIAASNIQPYRELTSDEQEEAAAYKQKLDAGDLKQQADKKQATQEQNNDEEIGNYL